ncbi:unnamed protein product, partial [Ectocarpus sp. 6 AP-2014]
SRCPLYFSQSIDFVTTSRVDRSSALLETACQYHDNLFWVGRTLCWVGISRVLTAQHAIRLLHRDNHHSDHNTSGGISIRISLSLSIDNPSTNTQTQATPYPVA